MPTKMIWKKVFSDFWAAKSKTGLALFALFIGAWGLTSVVYTYYISKQNLHDNYMRTNPASVILKIAAPDSNLIKQVSELTYVSDIEIRMNAGARIWQKTKQWMPISIFSVQRFGKQTINTFRIEAGKYPTKGQLIIERDGARYLEGDVSFLQLQQNKEVNLKLTGTVHDPGLPPSHMENAVWGYVTPETFKQLFPMDTETRLLVKFTGNEPELLSIQKNTEQLIKFITKNGGTVTRFDIPPPGKHPHEGQLQSL